MGWFWSTSNGGASDDASTTTSTSPTPPPPPPRAAAPPKPTAAASTSGTDQEVAKFFSMLQEAHTPAPKPQPQQQEQQQQQQEEQSSRPPLTPPSQQSSSSTLVPSWIPNPFSALTSTTTNDEATTTPRPTKPYKPRSPASLAISESQLPTDMSCQDAFDYAWHCHTPGSQLNSVYRHGSVRTCSELWEDFWFCMRIKSWTPEARAEAIRDHFRQKEETKYGGGKPSSEDVWDSRDELVKPGSAFSRPFDPPITDDKEFARMDDERRRALREMDQEERRRRETEGKK